MTERKIPELLAPVGGMQQLKAAVQNGADAVYMGGPLFNARIKAENFTYNDIKEAVVYAHQRNVKVYITLNTLIKDKELPKALNYVNQLENAGVDGVILQDMGISRLIKKYFPHMPMHLSTQGTIYNKWAIDTVKDLGFERVVPARELTLEEIKKLTKECHHGEKYCEVEVFVHGALCMCYSGQCHMSRVIGGINGRSGNRGLCAQPCRLPYYDENGKEGYLLSPKDICTIENIPDLIEAGVDSFKIEGRLKSPQYVAVVTSIYRKYLDMYEATGFVKVTDEDKVALLQIFNRGGFTKGYLYGNPKDKILSGDSPKNTGRYIGKVVKAQQGKSKSNTPKGKHEKGAHLIEIECIEDISIGDGIEIRGKYIYEKPAGNIITYIKPVKKGILRIGDIKERVFAGDKVYKVTDKEQLRVAEESFASDYKRKSEVDIALTIHIGEKPAIAIKEKITGLETKITGDELVERAKTKPSDKDRIEVQLAKLGETPFRAGKIEIKMDQDAIIPISSVNKLRRTAIDELLKLKGEISRKGYTEEEIQLITEKEALGKIEQEDLLKRCDKAYRHIYNKKQLNEAARSFQKDTILMPLEIFMQNELQSEQKSPKVLPYILNISKGKLDIYIEENFEAIVERVRETGIVIGNLGWIKRFQDAGIRVYGDYGLNVYNEQSIKTFEELGIEIIQLSQELNEDIKTIPLMITEHPIKSNKIVDRKRAIYDIIENESGDKWMIFKE